MLEVTLVNKPSRQVLTYTQIYDQIVIKQGFNWIGVYVDDKSSTSFLDGKSDITVYLASPTLSPTGSHTTQTISFIGYYDDTMATTSATEIVIGCFLFNKASNSFGSCMQGYIYLIRIYSGDHFNTTYTIGNIHSCSGIAGAASCYLCSNGYGNVCFSKLLSNTTAYMIEQWNMNNNVKFPSGIKSTIASPSRDMVENKDRENYVVMLTSIGYVFGQKSYTYILPDLGPSSYFPFPPMFTIEAWIKLDLVTPPPSGLVMPVFGKYTSADPTDEYDRTYKLGFAVSNYFLRVYLGSFSADVSFQFINEA